MVIDLTGQRFGRLEVVSQWDNEKRGAYWLCVCDCGRTTIIRGRSLRSGHTRSCGCIHDELSSLRTIKRNTTHGESDTRLYGIWSDMRKRCENSKHIAFVRYGGRGISVCEEWYDYENFADWAKENGYTDNLTLDRIENDEGYSPTNCRWTTRSVQARNKSNNVVYTYEGKSLTIPEWSELTGINTSTLYSRLTRYGWSVEKALTTPSRRLKSYDSP